MTFVDVLDKIAFYGSTGWLILSFIVPFFRKTWFMFIILSILHYSIHSKWKAVLIMVGFFVGIRLLTLILPIWVLQIISVGVIIFLFVKYKKIIDTQGGTIYSEAQIMSAKAQLGLIKKLKAKGKNVSDELIQELEDVINGKKTPNKGKIKRTA